MKQGHKVKLPSWAGYWCSDEEGKFIWMHTKDGEILEIRETSRLEYTLSNVLSDEWMIADENNCPYLGGTATFGFDEALKYIKRGFKVTRRNWNGRGQYVFLAKDIEFSTEADLSEFNPNGDTEHTEANEVYVYDCLVIRTADRKLQVGWLATQSDMLAEDWMFAE